MRENLAKFSIPNSDEQNSDVDTSYFRIPGQALIKENCHNSRTSDDIDMKVGPVTKLYKKNKTTSKKLAMKSCLQIVTSWSFLSVYDQFWAIQKLDSGHRVSNYLFVYGNLLSNKNWKQNWKISKAALTLIFLQKKCWHKQN